MKYKDLEDEWTRHWYQFILDNLDKHNLPLESNSSII